MKNSLTKKIITVSLSILFAVSLVLTPISPLFPVHKADAALPTIDLANIYQTTLSAINTTGLFQKEFFLDAIAWGLVNGMLEQMLQSTIQWVNSGFDGKPLFVTDLRGLMLDVGDIVFDDFVNQNGLNFLCEPFRLDALFSLEITYVDYYRNYVPRCSLKGVLANAQSFKDYTNGGFRAGGGWNSWYDVALTPSNNPIGAVVKTNEVLNSRIANVQKTQNDEIAWNDGFFDYKECGEPGCETVTPGKTIQSQLNKALFTGQDRLTVADEIDELLSALLTQLVGQALGSGGVRGLSSGNSSGNYYSNVDRTPPPSTIPSDYEWSEPSVGPNGLPTGVFGGPQEWSPYIPNFNTFGYVSPICKLGSPPVSPHLLESSSCRASVAESVALNVIGEFYNLEAHIRTTCNGADNTTDHVAIEGFLTRLNAQISIANSVLSDFRSSGVDYSESEIVAYSNDALNLYTSFVSEGNSLPCQ